MPAAINILNTMIMFPKYPFKSGSNDVIFFPFLTYLMEVAADTTDDAVPTMPLAPEETACPAPV